jgi:hypothetical protein
MFLNIADGDLLPEEAVEDGETQQGVWCAIQALPSLSAGRVPAVHRAVEFW